MGMGIYPITILSIIKMLKYSIYYFIEITALH